MKKYWINFLFLFLCGSAVGQQRMADSLKRLLPTDNDTLGLVYNCLISLAYENTNQDSATLYARNYLELSQKLNYKLEQADALRQLAYYRAGSATGLELIYEAQRIVEEDHDKKILPVKYLEMLHIPVHLQSYSKYKQHVYGFLLFLTGIQYWANNENEKAISHWSQTLKIGRALPDSQLLMLSYIAFGTITKNNDSSLAYHEKSYQLAQVIEPVAIGGIEGNIAKNYEYRKDYKRQLFYLRASIEHNMQHGIIIALGWSYLRLAKYYGKNILNRDSSLFYGGKALQTALLSNFSDLLHQTTQLFFETYKKEGNRDSTFKYLDLMLAAKEKISNEEEVRKFANADFNQQMKQAAIEAANEKLRNRVKIYGLLAGLAVVVLLAIFFWRNAKRRRREYSMLQTQKRKTDQALQELKTTQAQLIQSEKMASLGELTAGIAHEIQNPLNFVNNFSEVNSELIQELKAELKAGNHEDAIAIANHIADNEQKINHHGKRADGIVKNMLQHSRSSSGKKEPTNINSLADEYLKLAYHGLRAKDSSFNASMKTGFDETIGNINVVPQDIGRVILNLITNAFYAVTEKKKQAGDEYEPTVSVTTKRNNDTVELRVKDNGNGIPQKLLDKIFQPFFTTKPTGEGTGLGLSLSYDIVKAHGGEIKVETREGEGVESLIIFPL